MKTNFNLKNGLGGPIRSAAAALFILGSFGGVCQPFSSPVGTWDVVMSGCRDGVALMTFNSDQTISMMEILVPKPTRNSGFSQTRGPNGDSSRTGTVDGSTNGLPVHTNIFGGVSFPVPDFNQTNTDTGTSINGSVLAVHGGEEAGRWGFDSGGRIIGFFTELSPASALVTNLIVLGTNNPPFIDNPTLTNSVPFYLTNVTFLRFTNAINFTGKVTLGAKPRLTGVCSTPDGKATFAGLPPLPQTDFSGAWFGTKVDEGLPYNEFFNLSVEDAAENLYGVDGSGPGYTYSGSVIVSRQKKIGFAVGRNLPLGSPEIVRAIYGSVDLRHVRFSGKGWENKASGTIDRVSFKAARNGGGS
jgi:hypothetical protein